MRKRPDYGSATPEDLVRDLVNVRRKAGRYRQSGRGGDLVPIGEVIGGLDGPVQAIRDASPQALHHFTQADQVNQLVSASEADPVLGFMARTMALCSLPRTNPGNRKEYIRCNGPYTLGMGKN